MANMSTVFALFSLILGLIVWARRFIVQGMLSHNKTLLTCSFLFLLYLVNTQALSQSLLFKMQSGTCVFSVYRLFAYSNHFIISPVIIFLFSRMIPILHVRGTGPLT
ncbi:hypothetical protein DCMF_20375 [Candidatus Formimonas warabiya]|uniref:Uncharacterized protein n=1 Tax=Formimonas warabiya TaxID=1761012 RepID=A0A3G1KWD6_FORW1|nr:hypothetical protein DCMF_20375 [Candidatus Formimonas warabiya]